MRAHLRLPSVALRAEGLRVRQPLLASTTDARAIYLRRQPDPHDRRQQILSPALERIRDIRRVFDPIRLIGTVRREFLDHVLFWNARDLERKLADFQAYYNAARSHASFDGHTPLAFAGRHTVARAELNNVRWVSHCRDLVQLPVAA
jgi:hypothetical protein